MTIAVGTACSLIKMILSSVFSTKDEFNYTFCLP